MRRSEIRGDSGDEPVPQFIGSYAVLARLSNHKATAVFRAYDKEHRRDVCIKRLTPVGAKSASSVASMRREVDYGRRLDHPGLVAHFAHDTSSERHFFVMEYFAPGATLTQSHLLKDTPFTAPPLKPTLTQVLEVLGYLHRSGIVHRDLKPDNVLINETGAVKVIDLSVAFETERRLARWRRWLGMKHKVVGTRTYMPPEQIEGRDVDGRADLYAFGVMFFELLAGRPPFTGDNPDHLLRAHLRDTPPMLSTVNPQVTPEASQLASRLLAKDPGLRPQRCEDVLHFLNRNRLLKSDPD